MTARDISEAARAAQRFQLIANFHLSKPNGAAFQRDGQALMERLWAIGFRPAGQSADLPTE